MYLAIGLPFTALFISRFIQFNSSHRITVLILLFSQRLTTIHPPSCPLPTTLLLNQHANLISLSHSHCLANKALGKKAYSLQSSHLQGKHSLSIALCSDITTRLSQYNGTPQIPPTSSPGVVLQRSHMPPQTPTGYISCYNYTDVGSSIPPTPLLSVLSFSLSFFQHSKQQIHLSTLKFSATVIAIFTSSALLSQHQCHQRRRKRRLFRSFSPQDPDPS